MKRWEWQSAGGRTFIVYAADHAAACRRFARIGRHERSKPVFRCEALTARPVNVIDERRAPGA